MSKSNIFKIKHYKVMFGCEKLYPSIKPKYKPSVYLYFRLGYCGSDEEVKALTLVAIGAAERFCELFSEKSSLSWPLKRPERP